MGQLSDYGYDKDRLNDIRVLVDAPKSDLFDVLSYILFTTPQKTRQARAEGVKVGNLNEYEPEMQQLLLGVLTAYEETGVSELATKKLGQFLTAKYGSVSEGKAKLGELSAIKTAYLDLQTHLYAK